MSDKSVRPFRVFLRLAAHKQAKRHDFVAARPRICHQTPNQHQTRPIEVVDGLAANGEDGNAEVEAKVKAKVAELCARFPIYPNL